MLPPLFFFGLKYRFLSGQQSWAGQCPSHHQHKSCVVVQSQGSWSWWEETHPAQQVLWPRACFTTFPRRLLGTGVAHKWKGTGNTVLMSELQAEPRCWHRSEERWDTLVSLQDHLPGIDWWRELLSVSSLCKDTVLWHAAHLKYCSLPLFRGSDFLV